MSNGWVFNVKTRMSDDFETSETYYVRLPGRQDAEDAVRRYLGAREHAVEACLPVESSVFDAMNILDYGVVHKVD